MIYPDDCMYLEFYHNVQQEESALTFRNIHQNGEWGWRYQVTNRASNWRRCGDSKEKEQKHLKILTILRCRICNSKSILDVFVDIPN